MTFSFILYQAKSLEFEMAEPDFWSDQDQAKQKSQRLDELNDELNKWNKITIEINDLAEITNEALKEKDKSLINYYQRAVSYSHGPFFIAVCRVQNDDAGGLFCYGLEPLLYLEFSNSLFARFEKQGFVELNCDLAP